MAICATTSSSTPVRNTRLPNSLSFKYGLRRRICRTANTATSATPASVGPKARASRNPNCSRPVTPTMNTTNPNVYSSTDGTSSAMRSCLPTSRTTSDEARSDAMATKPSSRKMVRHPSASVMMPDSVGPTTGANPNTSPTRPRAWPYWSFG